MARTSAPRSTKARATSAPRSPVAPITSTIIAAVLATASVDPVREPRPGPGVGRELTVPQQLACALRILAHEGWRENLSGHITWATPDGGMWCNPWGIWWDEVRASDILRLDADGDDRGRQVGRHAGGVPAHRTAPRPRRRDHHRAQPSVLRDVALGDERDAADGAPELVHLHGELALVDEYAGVEDAEQGSGSPTQVGDASGILLAHHGAIVTGTTIGEACYKAVTFERMCRFTYDILAAGRTPDEIPADQRGRAEVDAAPEHAARVLGRRRPPLDRREPEVLT